MPFERSPNEVGAAWVRENEKGEYLSIALHVDVILQLAGGMVDEANLSAYPIRSSNPKAPQYRLMYYPGAGQGAVEAVQQVAPPRQAERQVQPPRQAPRQAPPQAPPQRPAARPQPRAFNPPPDEDDDIPF